MMFCFVCKEPLRRPLRSSARDTWPTFVHTIRREERTTSVVWQATTRHRASTISVPALPTVAAVFAYHAQLARRRRATLRTDDHHPTATRIVSPRCSSAPLSWTRPIKRTLEQKNKSIIQFYTFKVVSANANHNTQMQSTFNQPFV